jgi:CDP-diacylglycerol--glycerol-3-phosphate 3-phosphatidyltransferase
VNLVKFDSKVFFQRLFRPAANFMADKGITANQVTGSTMLLSLGAGTAVCLSPGQRWPLITVLSVVFVRLAFNHIDGMLAREHGMATPLGGILNELSDVISDTALFLPLATISGIAPWPVFLAVLFGVITEMAGVVGLAIGAGRREDGPLSKKPRGTCFAIIILAIILGAPPGGWMNVLLILVLPLMVLTIINRVKGAIREVTP